ncbi:MAG: 2-C-methyl-D-erythritol 4-phosphate cytidylyltransferase [Aquificota bacterium]|jgi:2-C-methyl-D-erythritol 4-phosphate cytidylyltransferase
MVSLILLLAGKGSRFGGKKQFLTFKGKPLFEYILQEVEGLFKEILLVVPPEDKATFERNYSQYKIVAGGSERQYSVLNGLKEVTNPKVVVHDGARPLATRDLFQRVINLNPYDGKITAIPVRDTIKKVFQGRVKETLDRKNLWAVQTPQAFKTEILLKCHQKALEENFFATDDAALLEHYGYTVGVELGDPKNIKITYPSDWEIVQCLLERKLQNS